MISIRPTSKKLWPFVKFWTKNFFTDFFIVKQETQKLILKLLKNIGKGFLLQKNLSKTDHMTRNHGLSNLLCRSTKIFYRSLLLNVVQTPVMFKIPIVESYHNWRFEVSLPKRFFCKSHSKVGKIKMPKITKWHFQRSLYSKVY